MSCQMMAWLYVEYMDLSHTHLAVGKGYAFHKNSDAVYFYDPNSNKQSRQITNMNFKRLSSLVGIPGEKADSNRILSDYMKISSQNFWQDSSKNSGWNYWFNLINFNKPYLGKASIFRAIPLHRSSRRISWAIDIIYSQSQLFYRQEFWCRLHFWPKFQQENEKKLHV